MVRVTPPPGNGATGASRLRIGTDRYANLTPPSPTASLPDTGELSPASRATTDSSHATTPTPSPVPPSPDQRSSRAASVPHFDTQELLDDTPPPARPRPGVIATLRQAAAGATSGELWGRIMGQARPTEVLLPPAAQVRAAAMLQRQLPIQGSQGMTFLVGTQTFLDVYRPKLLSFTGTVCDEILLGPHRFKAGDVDLKLTVAPNPDVPTDTPPGQALEQWVQEGFEEALRRNAPPMGVNIRHAFADATLGGRIVSDHTYVCRSKLVRIAAPPGMQPSEAACPVDFFFTTDALADTPFDKLSASRSIAYRKAGFFLIQPVSDAVLQLLRHFHTEVFNPTITGGLARLTKAQAHPRYAHQAFFLLDSRTVPAFLAQAERSNDWNALARLIQLLLRHLQAQAPQLRDALLTAWSQHISLTLVRHARMAGRFAQLTASMRPTSPFAAFLAGGAPSLRLDPRTNEIDAALIETMTQTLYQVLRSPPYASLFATLLTKAFPLLPAERAIAMWLQSLTAPMSHEDRDIVLQFLGPLILHYAQRDEDTTDVLACRLIRAMLLDAPEQKQMVAAIALAKQDSEHPVVRTFSTIAGDRLIMRLALALRPNDPHAILPVALWLMAQTDDAASQAEGITLLERLCILDPSVNNTMALMIACANAERFADMEKWLLRRVARDAQALAEPAERQAAIMLHARTGQLEPILAHAALMAQPQAEWAQRAYGAVAWSETELQEHTRQNPEAMLGIADAKLAAASVAVGELAAAFSRDAWTVYCAAVGLDVHIDRLTFVRAEFTAHPHDAEAAVTLLTTLAAAGRRRDMWPYAKQALALNPALAKNPIVWEAMSDNLPAALEGLPILEQHAADSYWEAAGQVLARVAKGVTAASGAQQRIIKTHAMAVCKMLGQQLQRLSGPAFTIDDIVKFWMIPLGMAETIGMPDVGLAALASAVAVSARALEFELVWTKAYATQVLKLAKQKYPSKGRGLHPMVQRLLDHVKK